MRPSVVVRKLPGLSSFPTQPTNCHERSKIRSFSSSSHSGCVYHAAGSVRPGSYANPSAIGGVWHSDLGRGLGEDDANVVFEERERDVCNALACVQPSSADGSLAGTPARFEGRRPNDPIYAVRTGYRRWVTPMPATTFGFPRTTGVFARCSNSRTPAPSNTAARSTWISSSNPASRHCWIVLAPCTPTDFERAADFA